MSLAIDYSKIVEVLIGGEWYGVNEGTFNVDAYEFVEEVKRDEEDIEYLILYNGGDGFSFEWNNGGERMSGPMTWIQAVRHS